MKSITIYNMEEDYPAAADLVEETLQLNRINRVTHTETMMIFEALYHNLQEKLTNSNGTVTLMVKRGLSGLKIIFGFAGGMMDPVKGDSSFSPETQILETYSDKIDYSYRFGHNKVEIEVSKSVQLMQLIYFASIFAAILAYALIQYSMDTATQHSMRTNIIMPLEQLFANAMIMVAAPVTFFSLLKNRIHAYIASEWNANVRRLYRASTGSSIIAVLLAVGAAMAITRSTKLANNVFSNIGELQLDFSISETISGLLPSNIFEPFITISPFPLIILAFMMTYAFFSAGKHFNLINQLIDALYVIFSRLLSMIMFSLPFFLFVSFLDVLMQRGYEILVFLLQTFALVLAGLILLMLYYFARLLRAKINPFSFLRKLIPLLWENFLIGSCIDAVPYNIRWCMQNLKLDRKKLQESMPVMAQINLDGNCFLIAMTSLLFISYSGTPVSFLNLTGIGILVFFLSMGAPNQPGSCLIGLLIIFYHMNATALVPYAIFTEVLLGGLQNLINVLGDIITVMVDNPEERAEKNKAAQSSAARP